MPGMGLALLVGMLMIAFGLSYFTYVVVWR